MIDDDPPVSLIAPTRAADHAVAASRQRIDWSSTQLRAADETSARAREALRQSYARLRRAKAMPPEPSSET